MGKSSWISWLVLTLAGAAALPQRAGACSCSSSPIYRSDPEDSAEGVALNAALLVMGAFALDSLTLADEDGQPVAFALHAGPTPTCEGTSADLVPKQALEPNTTYVVEVQPLYPSDPRPTSVTFTTGSSMLPDRELEPPTASASVFLDVPPDGFSCGEGTVHAFIDVPDWKDVEVVATRGERALLHWMLVSGQGSFKLEEAPDCLEFRRRAPNGRRSAPVVLCGDELAERPFPGAEGVRGAAAGAPPAIVEQDASTLVPIRGVEAAASWDTAASTASPVRSRSGGCSAVRSAPASSAASLALLFALVRLARRRRGAKRLLFLA